MDEDTKVKLVENTLEVIESMLNAWMSAGGVIRLSELKSMTASHLLEIMAINSIRFCLKELEIQCPWADGGGVFGKTFDQYQECGKCMHREACQEAKE